MRKTLSTHIKNENDLVAKLIGSGFEWLGTMYIGEIAKVYYK